MLLFIDADIGFDPCYVVQLVNLQLKMDCHVIGGAYLQKFINGSYVVKTLDGRELDLSATNPIEVAYLGAGFMLIPRATFELFKRSYSSYTLGGGAWTLYFSSGIFDDKLLSEDALFCNMIRQAGGKVWCCPWMKLAHFGNHVYGGPPRGV